MLARARFDQYAAAEFALSHPRLAAALQAIPYPALHRLLAGATWLETWLRWPLKTIKMSEGLAAAFAAIDPDGRRFGLTDEVRRRFWRNRMYLETADLFVLLASLDKAAFRRRAIAVEGHDLLLLARDKGPGAIVLGFRLGVYPLLPLALGAMGHEVTMVVGAEPLAGLGKALGGRFAPASARRVRYLSARDPLVLARCREALDARGVVSTLMELSPQQFNRTASVRFLGWEVNVPYGIPYLAAATGRSIVPAVFVREPGPRFRLRFLEPLPPPAGKAEVLRTTQELYSLLERQVLLNPDQWVGWTLLKSHLGVDTSRSPEAAPGPAR